MLTYVRMSSTEVAERIEIIPVTIAANTAIATPSTTALAIPQGVMTRIEMRWPPGPAGLVGIRVAHSSQVIIPRTGNNWLISDDEAIDWPVEGYPTGNKWSVVGYNTDINPHTIYFRFHLNELVSKVQAMPVAVPIL